MLSAYRSKLLEELCCLRLCDPAERPFQLGYVSGLLGAYLHTGAISLKQYDALQLLKNNACENNQVMHSQPGQPAQRSPREV